MVTLASLLTETATVTSYADTTDEYGNVVAGTATTAEWPARLEQLSTEEIVRDEDTVLADWRIFLPATAAITPYNTVEARGLHFTVFGYPNQQRAPWGLHHLEVQLKLTL